MSTLSLTGGHNSTARTALRRRHEKARAEFLADQALRRKRFRQSQTDHAAGLRRGWRIEEADMHLRQINEREGLLRRHALDDAGKTK